MTNRVKFNAPRDMWFEFLGDGIPQQVLLFLWIHPASKSIAQSLLEWSKLDGYPDAGGPIHGHRVTEMPRPLLEENLSRHLGLEARPLCPGELWLTVKGGDGLAEELFSIRLRMPVKWSTVEFLLDWINHKGGAAVDKTIACAHVTVADKSTLERCVTGAPVGKFREAVPGSPEGCLTMVVDMLL